MQGLMLKVVVVGRSACSTFSQSGLGVEPRSGEHAADYVAKDERKQWSSEC